VVQFVRLKHRWHLNIDYEHVWQFVPFKKYPTEQTSHAVDEQYEQYGYFVKHDPHVLLLVALVADVIK
jgi:hypothetical protein